MEFYLLLKNMKSDKILESGILWGTIQGRIQWKNFFNLLGFF